MSILADGAILNAIEAGEIKIEPMAPWAVGTNSIDLHLSKHLATCEPNAKRVDYLADWDLEIINTNARSNINRFEIDPKDGYILEPGILYLGSTVEWTSSGPYLPFLDGTSGAGRLGISVHVTAGKGDVGFQGHWTLELTVVHPVRVYGGEPVAQIFFHTVVGTVMRLYHSKIGSNYGGDHDPLPQASRMWNKKRWTGEEL